MEKEIYRYFELILTLEKEIDKYFELILTSEKELYRYFDLILTLENEIYRKGQEGVWKLPSIPIRPLNESQVLRLKCGY